MNKYFTIEKERDLEIEKTDTEQNNIEQVEEKKYYSIHIEGLPYGTLIRETDDYSEALNIYRQIKNSFNFYECKIVLQKHIVKGEEEEIKNIYVKNIGEDFGIEKHLNDILNSLEQLDKMKKMYTTTHSECDKYLSAFSHSLEKINAERLSEDQMRNIFRSIEEKGALRRIAKSQVDHLTNLQHNLNSIRSNVNKALEIFKKTEYHRNTQKAIENRIAKDNEYLSIIGLL